jgi:hypothetical protein
MRDAEEWEGVGVVAVVLEESSARPLSYVVSLTRALGIVSIVVGVFFFMLLAVYAPLLFAIVYRVVLVFILGGYIVPGIVMIGLSFPLQRRKIWAAITLLVIQGFQVLPLLFTMLQAGGGTRSWILINAGLPAIIVVFAIITIIVLAKALPLVRDGVELRQMGFDPILTPLPAPEPQD